MSADERGNPAEAARDEAVRVLAGTAVNIALLVGLSMIVEHRQVIAARGRRLLARARRRAPDVDELAVSDFRTRVTAYDHAEDR